MTETGETTTVTMRHPAPNDGRFATDAFADSVGDEIPVTTLSGGTMATVESAVVVDDGRAVHLTLKVKASREELGVDLGPYSDYGMIDPL